MALGGKHTSWALPAMGGLVAGVLLVFLGFGAPGAMEGGCGNFEGGQQLGTQEGAMSDMMAYADFDGGGTEGDFNYLEADSDPPEEMVIETATTAMPWISRIISNPVATRS